MSWDINRVIIVGRLTRDVELKYTPGGTAVAKFGIAVGGKPKPDGSDSVSFFNVSVYGKTAENCSKFLAKGKQIAVDGSLEQRSWTAQDSSRRSVVEIIADRVEFLGSPGGAKGGTFQKDASAPAQASTPAASQAKPAAPAVEGKPNFEDNFYDNTDFNPSPVDPSELADEPNPNDPNF
jgi:single-strand DNA-binding protein